MMNNKNTAKKMSINENAIFRKIFKYSGNSN